MGLLDRAEPETATAARRTLLRDRLAADPEASAADFCKLMLAPSVNMTHGLPSRGKSAGEPISSVAFVSPTGMWSAAVLQHVSSTAMRRTGRTSVIDPEGAAQRALIEYIDVDMPEIGPLRALSLAAEPAAFASVAPLMERLSLLVFMMASSDAEGFIGYVRAWLELPQVISAGPRVLVLAGMAPERVAGMLEPLRAGTPLTLEFARVKLSDSAAVWQAAQKPLQEQTATARASARSWAPALADDGRTLVDIEVSMPHPSGRIAGESSADAVAILVAETGCLHELIGLDGALATALIDAGGGMALRTLDPPGAAPRSFDAEAEFLRAKYQLAQSMGLDNPIEDIVLLTQRFLYIYRALPRRSDLFLLVVFDRERAPPAMARLRVQDVVGALALLSI